MAEHLIPITISLDDETIEKKATEYASKMVAEEVLKATHKTDYSGRVKENDFEPIMLIVKEKVDVILKENENLIIQEAIKLLADKLSKTKKCKELLKQVTE